MGEKNNVFANGREISCKAASGKTICCFPDICFTPPRTPALPTGIPIPYPNTAFSKHAIKGSKSVFISGKPVMLKNKSYFKKSTGNEPGCANKGIITRKTKGKAYFTSWSMNVKIEGKNVCRHMDLTTHNHGSMTNTLPWPYLDEATSKNSGDPCKAQKERVKENCKDQLVYHNYKRLKNPVKIKKNGKVTGYRIATANSGQLDYNATKKKLCNDFSKKARECKKSLKCNLMPHKKNLCCSKKRDMNKRWGQLQLKKAIQAAHHLIQVHSFYNPSGRKLPVDKKLLEKFKSEENPKNPEYKDGDAPCVCATAREHTKFHKLQGKDEDKAIKIARKNKSNPKWAWTYTKARESAIKAHKKIFSDSKCSAVCLRTQLDAYHKQKNKIEGNTLVRTVHSDEIKEAAKRTYKTKKSKYSP